TQVPEIFTSKNNGPTFLDQLGLTFSPITQFLWFMFRLFAFSAVAVLLTLFVPKHAETTQATIVKYPVLSGSLGLLAIFVCIPVVILLAITIILSPASFIIVVLVSVAVLFGWVVAGLEVGRRLGDALNQSWSMALQAGVGAFVLAFMVGITGFILWEGLGGMLALVVGCMGLGAVILTRFGTRDYLPPANQYTPPKLEEEVMDEEKVEKKETKTAKNKSPNKPKKKE
ncbi:MAG: hypothetical protein N2D54_12100, partial [Chloroflexota bacterium]